jgi:hypothetical protein
MTDGVSPTDSLAHTVTPLVELLVTWQNEARDLLEPIAPRLHREGVLPADELAVEAPPVGARPPVEGEAEASCLGAAPAAGAGDCVAAATSVVAQRRAHASAQANEVLRLILRADRTLDAGFEATAAVTKCQNGIIVLLFRKPRPPR